MKRLLHSIVLLTVLPGMAPAFASEPLTQHTVKLSQGENSPGATLSDIKWLAGHWVGKGFGGDIEEMWFEPAGGQMSGMFRLHGGNNGPSYALMTLIESRGSLVLRLRQFEENLSTMGGQDEILTYPLVAKGEGVMHFQGMSFHLAGDSLTVHVADRKADKSAEEFTFNYRRAPVESGR